MIERFFRTAKEELFWQYNLRDTDQAFDRFAKWSVFYNTQRPHSALAYQSPSEFRRQIAAEVVYESREHYTITMMTA